MGLRGEAPYFADGLSDNVRELRLLLHFTTKEVSEATGLSLSYLNDIERGRTEPSIRVVRQLAEFFEVEPWYHIFAPQQEGGQMHNNMYVPITSAVIAVQWDGTPATLRYLQTLLRFGRHSARTNGRNELIINDDRDQRGQYIPIPVGHWVVALGNGEGFHIEDADSFEQKYMKLPAGV